MPPRTTTRYSSRNENRRQGEIGPNEIAGALGYISPAELYEDFKALAEREGRFTEEEFIEEYGIETSAFVGNALASLGHFHGYDITAGTKEGEAERHFGLNESW